MREAGPIPGWTGTDLGGLHRGALAFTAMVGVILLAVAATWTSSPFDLTARSSPPHVLATASPAPVVTAPPATAPPRDELASRWVAQYGDPVLVVGGTTTITLQFRNAGGATWRRGSPSEVRLGIVGDQVDAGMALDWPYPTRPAVQEEAVVVPGAMATFAFKVKGTRAGTFRLHLRPVVDGIAWLDDEGVYVDLKVMAR